MLFIVDILRFPPSRLTRRNMLEKIDKNMYCQGFAYQVAAFIFTECFSTADISVQFI